MSSDLVAAAAQLTTLAGQIPLATAQALGTELDSVAGQANSIVAGTGHEQIVQETLAVKDQLVQQVTEQLRALGQKFEETARAIVAG